MFKIMYGEIVHDVIGYKVEEACVPRPTEWHFGKEHLSAIITSKRDITADVKRVFGMNSYKFPLMA